MSELIEPTSDPVSVEALAEAAAAESAAVAGEGARARRPSLWHHADFMKIWTAATVSLMGSQVSQLAIPFIAAVLLNATPLEVSLLGVVEMLPFVLFTLPAGAWLDRARRRPVLIAGDFGRAIALVTIPIAYAAGVLTIWQLYLVGLVAGTLTVFFDVADQSYLPVLLDREDLVEGNAKLSLSGSAAQIAGPGLSAGLIGIVGAPFAIIGDAASFLASGGLISLVRRPEQRPERRLTAAGSETSMRQEIAEGLRYVLGHPNLRMIAATTGTSNFGSNLAFSIFAIFVYRELHLSIQLVGLAFSLGAFGVLAGALTSGFISKRLGLGPTIVGSAFLSGAAGFLYALMPSEAVIAGALLAASGFLSGFSVVVYNVAQVSYRQAITPLDMQGRMNATMRFIVWGTIPFGALAGGLLASFLPVRTTVLIGAAVESLAFVWVLLSPVRSLREIPAGEPTQA
jgi:MFS family permease